MKTIDHTFSYLKKPMSTTSAIYSEYRKAWYDRPTKREPGEYPVHVDIETTTCCNLRCRMCFQSFDKPEPTFMDKSLVKKIIDEISGHVYSMKFQYRGEPTLDQNLPDYIHYAKMKGITEVMINTNANLIDGILATKLIKSGLDKLICSVEGSNEAVYNETRIGGNFKTVVSNIKQLISVRDMYGYDKPIVRVQMVKTENNAGDVKKFQKFWGKIVDEVAVEDELDYRAENTDTNVLEGWACPQLYQRLIVLADGDIVPCCRSIIGGTGKQVVLGNVKDISIKDAWKRLLSVRKIHEAGFSHQVDMCARCGIRKDMVKKVNA